MTTFDRVKKLADRQKISIVELEEKLNFGKNSLYRWKNSSPASDKLQKVADYFNVSTDYLLGRTNIPNQIENISEEEVDPLVYYRMDDTDMSPEDMEEVRRQIEFAERLAREQIRNRKGGN
ncbi:TPA: helix-turn-helix transcriptional regulator [Enterococcus faecium]|uniref:helix-turn-helix domain-containing protein n=1 Tax=Enterococcus faecium TaxID=1352 RepID=UPI000BDF3553|nr:helix-turn-helix transcriptional regulator [Enterococcus faecium]DAH94221.1 MAG TPA: repressor protein [Caudoviricetes sp.]MCC9080230.1 helix-turn-helix domain-containing protein [Enterococcus faecium]MCC9085022.1 helix-turn-helix domain-containing protein [Enterococcus faecium]PCT05077.1 transcriptional regulator [Enterococcus faecium]BDP64796.1 transcriptional regulator [Enterococcus faecium]